MIILLMDLRTKETYERKMEESKIEAEKARKNREEADNYRRQARVVLDELERIDMLIIDKRREMESAMRRSERCAKMKEEIRGEFNNLDEQIRDLTTKMDQLQTSMNSQQADSVSADWNEMILKHRDFINRRSQLQSQQDANDRENQSLRELLQTYKEQVTSCEADKIRLQLRAQGFQQNFNRLMEEATRAERAAQAAIQEAQRASL